MPLTRSAVDALGKRLAKSDAPTPEDLELLAQYRDEFRAAAAEVERVLAEELGLMTKGTFEGFEVTVTPRPAKTFSTLIDKFRRPGSNLSSVQDVAGLRIVGSALMTLSDQDRLRDVIVTRFPEAKVDDRRAIPSWGYRAVHIIPRIDGRRVEIQLRTHLQDTWANAVESIGDLWGRWVRYGLPPEGPPDEIAVRASVVSDFIRLSDLWYECEKAVLPLAEAKRMADMGDPDAARRADELRDVVSEPFRAASKLLAKITAAMVSQ